MKIGVDVGGTHTDAVVVDGNQVIASVKSLTTTDIQSGVEAAIADVLAKAGVEKSKIRTVIIGTTQFTNAVIERRQLQPVAAVRIGKQSSQAVPPKTKWPQDIAQELGQNCFMLAGGYDYTGIAIEPLKDSEIDQLLQQIERLKTTAIAICGVHASVNPEQELYLADKIRARFPHIQISLSHEVGRIGLLQRENAALLNAALMGLANKVVAAFKNSLSSLGIQAPLYISQNDGTVMQAEYAQRFPVLTFSSGPTNSMRGAAFLSGLDNAIVVDVGGTTADIGTLSNGFPRESHVAIEVGGVSTNFRMPDIIALGLGGGSLVSEAGDCIGPESVGHKLSHEGLVFGGQRLTASDIAVAAGWVAMGEPSKLDHLDQAVVQQAIATMQTMMAETIDRIKTGEQDVPLIAVGGGAFLVPETIPGISQVLRPHNAGVANAVGAALAEVSGESEILYSRAQQNREQAVSLTRAEAERKAVAAGADATTLRISDIEETSLAYMAEDTERLRIKVVGQLAIQSATAEEIAHAN